MESGGGHLEFGQLQVLVYADECRRLQRERQEVRQRVPIPVLREEHESDAAGAAEVAGAAP